MKTLFKSLFAAAAIGLWGAAASANHIAGSVICTDTSASAPLAGVSVTIQGTLNTYTGVTAADGTFYVSLDTVSDTYAVFIEVSSGLGIVSPAIGEYEVEIFAGGVGGPDSFDAANFELTGCVPPLLGQIGDTVYCDANGNGVQEAGELAIPGVTVILTLPDGTTQQDVTDANGQYVFSNLPAGVYVVLVDANSLPQACSVPVCPVTVTVNLAAGQNYLDADFCFKPPTTTSPGTGTPGYWKNHPEAWPLSEITISGRVYTKAQAIRMMKLSVSGHKERTIFNALVCAKLNVIMGNEASCIADAIALADQWMATYGSAQVLANSNAWKVGEPLYLRLDDYNNGRLCAPHRD